MFVTENPDRKKKKKTNTVDTPNYQFQVPPVNWFDLTLPTLSVSPVTILNTFPHRIQAHSPLQIQSLQSKPVTELVYHRNGVVVQTRFELRFCVGSTPTRGK